jgi:hypothetical protein
MRAGWVKVQGLEGTCVDPFQHGEHPVDPESAGAIQNINNRGPGHRAMCLKCYGQIMAGAHPPITTDGDDAG